MREAGYREIYRKYEPADARYLSNDRGHLMFLRPEEHEVCRHGHPEMLEEWAEVFAGV